MPLTIFRSNVSVWLGAPASRMKITFCALPLDVAPPPDPSAALRRRCPRYAPVTPAPRISKKRRRVQCGRLKNVLWSHGCFLKNSLIRSCSLLMAPVPRSIIEYEIDLVVERPGQILNRLRPGRAAGGGDCAHRRRHFGGRWVARQNREKQSEDQVIVALAHVLHDKLAGGGASVRDVTFHVAAVHEVERL